MAKSFTYKEARTLTEFYETVLKQLTTKKAIKDFYGDEMNRNVTTLIDSGFFGEMIDNNLEGKEINYADERLQTFLWTIYCFKQISKYFEICASLLNRYSKDVKGYLTRLSPGTNPIVWVFTPKKNKQLAEDAFEKLSQAKSGEAVNAAVHAINEIDSLKNKNYEKVFDDFWKEKEIFKKTLLSYNSFLVERSGAVSSFDKYIQQYRKTAQTLSEARSNLSSSESEIHASIDYMVAEKMTNTLRGIPVEELARGKTGLKIKFLKDAGYQNLADVFASSIYQISSCYGISQDAAYTIKNICNGYAKKIKLEQKIKLSVDEKSKASTKVVKAIFSYIRNKELCNRVNELDERYGGQLKDVFDTLRGIGNGCTWLFYSDEERNEIKSIFEDAKETITSKFDPVFNEVFKEFRKIKAANAATAWDDFQKNSIRYYNVIEEVYPGVLGTDDSIYGLPEKVAREIQDQCFFPDGLLCTLRKYQEWGVKYILHQERVLLGDEMGLGKTVQAIATMVSLRNTGATHFVVVCPASVVTNWCREIVKHSKLRVTKIHGVGKASAFKSWLKTGGVAVTNYESVSFLKMDDDFRFALLVVDEAHFIKNPGARRSVNTKSLANHTDRVLFMTGTALENRVDEMISLISILRPEVAQSAQSLAFMSSAPQFRERIASVYYRRKREDVLTELPDKIEKDVRYQMM